MNKNTEPGIPDVWETVTPETISVWVDRPSPRKTGTGILRALTHLRSSIERIGRSESDATLARLADGEFDKKRSLSGNECIRSGDYTASEYSAAEKPYIANFVDLIQKGEIGWKREKETDLLSMTFEVPVHAGSGRIRYYFGSKMEHSTTSNHIASLKVLRSDSMILASTGLKSMRPPVFEKADQIYHYEEIMFMDTSSHQYKLYKSSGIDTTPMSHRILSTALLDISNQDSFNIGTMPAPEIFPQGRPRNGEIED